MLTLQCNFINETNIYVNIIIQKTSCNFANNTCIFISVVMSGSACLSVLYYLSCLRVQCHINYHLY